MSDWIREMAERAAEALLNPVRFIGSNTGIIVKAINAALDKDREERERTVEAIVQLDREERDGKYTWHDVVKDCERLFDCPDTAESPLASNLPNLIRDLKASCPEIAQERADPLRMLVEMTKARPFRFDYLSCLMGDKWYVVCYDKEKDLMEEGENYDSPEEAIIEAHKELFKPKPKGDSNGDS